jgi:hypothetical protein
MVPIQSAYNTASRQVNPPKNAKLDGTMEHLIQGKLNVTFSSVISLNLALNFDPNSIARLVNSVHGLGCPLT